MQELSVLHPPGTEELRPEELEVLAAEVRALAAERDAVILAHNYQLPELQDVADFTGDSLQLSRQAAATDFSATIPGASADSTSAPRNAASRRRAVISTSGNSGTRLD